MARFDYMRLSVKPHRHALVGSWAKRIISLRDLDHKIEWMFQSQEPDTITHVGFHINQVIGTPGTFQISLRNIAASGVASSNIITSQTINPTSDMNGTFQWLELVAPLQVVRGQFLALVLNHVSGAIDASNFIQVWCAIQGDSGQWGRGFPYMRIIDHISDRRWGEFPVYGYKSAFRAYGLPLEEINSEAFNTPSQKAMRFWMNPAWGSTFRIKGAEWQGRAADKADRSVDMILYDASNTELERVTVDADIPQELDPNSINDTLFTGTMSTLEFGNEYFLAFEPQQADTNFELDCLQVTTSFDMQAFPGAAPFYLVERSVDTDDWTTVKNQRPMVDLIIEDWTKE